MLTTSGKSVLVLTLAMLAILASGPARTLGQEAGGEGDKPAAKADEPKAEEPKADEPKATTKPEGGEAAGAKPEAGEEKPAAATKPEAGEEKAAATTKPESGEDMGKAANTKELPVQWDDMLHYIKIARTDLALDHAKAILTAKVEPREIYLLAKNRPESMEVLTRGRGQRKDLAEAIVRIQELVAAGFYNMRQDPNEIAESIKLLAGGMRQYTQGVQRLKVSGEFCLPQLIQKMTDPQASEGLRDRIATMLPDLGPQAVAGLSAALACPNPQVQQAVAQALGRIQYPQAAPALKELMERKDVLPTVLKTAKAAYLICMGGNPETLKKTPSELYYDLGQGYYYRKESMLPDAQFDLGNVWHWDSKADALVYVPVPRAIFADIYAMRSARQALEHNAKNSAAVSLWLAAYLKKEADLGPDKKDPTQKEGAPTSWFYTLASSPRYVKEVAVRGLRDKDTPVIVGALKALAQTHGADSILKPLPSGDEPVVAALTYADRRVRFLAAVALADANPRERFSGSPQVVNVLNEALHQTGKKVAVVIVQDADVRNKMKDAVRAAGWDVVDEADVRKALLAARETPGVDAFVVGELATAGELVPLLRKDPMFVLTPVVLAAAGRNIGQVADADKRIVLIAPETAVADVKGGLEKALDVASGAPMTPAEARKWAVQAAQCIRTLGLTRNTVYDLQASRKALIDALDRTGYPDVQSAAADALAVVAGPESQRALVDSACKSTVAQAVRIAAFNAAAESVRRQGNLATEEQAARIIGVVNGKDPLPVREAAAKLLGTLDLPSDKIKDLVIQDQR